MRLLILSLIACAAVFSSCKKKTETPAPTPGTLSAFENKTDQPVTVDIYHTPGATGLKSDNIVFLTKISIPPNGTASLPASVATTNKIYAFDWYSDDFKLSGWPKNSEALNPNTTAFAYNPNGAKQPLTDIPDDRRLVALGGNGQKTHWKAIDAYDKNGISVWNTLTPVQHKIAFSIDVFGWMSDSSSILQQVDSKITTPIKRTFYIPEKDRFYLYAPYDPSRPKPVVLLSNNIDFVAPVSTTSPDTLFYVVYTRTQNDTTRTYHPPFYKVVKTSVEY